jgi:hypothetical protein
MAKLGMEKVTVMDKAKKEQVKHKHVPGMAYELDNPSLKLMNMIGGGFFNEPKYYDENRSYADFLTEIKEKGFISSRILDANGLTSQAKEVIETACAVANSDHPEDLLILANWARDPVQGLKLRTTPQILLAIAAAHPKTKPFVKGYAPLIIKRADEIRQVFAAFRHLFQSKDGLHKGSLPHSLRKGLAAAFKNFNEYQLMKYNGDQPSFKDVLLMISGSKKVKNPLSKELYSFLVKGKVENEQAVPMIAARAKFNKMAKEEKLTPEIIKEAGLTWENVLSKFGASKETWEQVLPSMPEMAVLRNLRNFEENKISRESWDYLCNKIRKKSVLLPFRYWAAMKEISTTDAMSYISQALDNSCGNLPNLSGRTLALCDNSGSAVSCAVSGKSEMKVAECGNMLMALIAKKLGRNAMIGVFGDSYKEIPFASSSSCMDIFKEIQEYALIKDRASNKYLAIPQYQRGQGVGGATETGLWWALQDITANNIKVDRIILFSDLCCYTQGDVNCGVRLKDFFGTNATIQGMIDKYRRQVNKDVFVYSINLNGHGQAQTRPDSHSMLLSGWSEQIYDIIEKAEQLVSVSAPSAKPELPALEVIRNLFGLNKQVSQPQN